MSKQELITRLTNLQDLGDTEVAHKSADNLLIDFINDNNIKKAYEAIDKWYA